MRIRTSAVLVPTLLAWCFLASPVAPAVAQQAKPDPWQPVRFMEGSWEGTSTGEGGAGTARRTYVFVLKGRYLHEKNVSTDPPQEKNKAGEVHEHWSSSAATARAERWCSGSSTRKGS